VNVYISISGALLVRGYVPLRFITCIYAGTTTSGIIVYDGDNLLVSPVKVHKCNVGERAILPEEIDFQRGTAMPANLADLFHLPLHGPYFDCSNCLAANRCGVRLCTPIGSTLQPGCGEVYLYPGDAIPYQDYKMLMQTAIDDRAPPAYRRAQQPPQATPAAGLTTLATGFAARDPTVSVVIDHARQLAHDRVTRQSADRAAMPWRMDARLQKHRDRWDAPDSAYRLGKALQGWSRSNAREIAHPWQPTGPGDAEPPEHLLLNAEGLMIASRRKLAKRSAAIERREDRDVQDIARRGYTRRDYYRACFLAERASERKSERDLEQDAVRLCRDRGNVPEAPGQGVSPATASAAAAPAYRSTVTLTPAPGVTLMGPAGPAVPPPPTTAMPARMAFRDDTCHHCGEAGHHMRACRFAVCWNCGRYGHAMRQCYNPRVGSCRTCYAFDHTTVECREPGCSNCGDPKHGQRHCPRNRGGGGGYGGIRSQRGGVWRSLLPAAMLMLPNPNEAMPTNDLVASTVTTLTTSTQLNSVVATTPGAGAAAMPMSFLVGAILLVWFAWSQYLAFRRIAEALGGFTSDRLERLASAIRAFTGAYRDGRNQPVVAFAAASTQVDDLSDFEGTTVEGLRRLCRIWGLAATGLRADLLRRVQSEADRRSSSTL
jgi:hypothetical protein